MTDGLRGASGTQISRANKIRKGAVPDWGRGPRHMAPTFHEGLGEITPPNGFRGTFPSADTKKNARVTGRFQFGGYQSGEAGIRWG
jgi:hypothetical protein